MKAPATAKFDNISLIGSDSGAFYAYFSVDAENGSGALVRSWVMCKHRPSDGWTEALIGVDAIEGSVQSWVLKANKDAKYVHLPPE